MFERPPFQMMAVAAAQLSAMAIGKLP